MLTASNLGQIIGRALYGELPPRRLDTIPLGAPKKYVDRKSQMIGLCGKLGSVRSRQVAEALGVDLAHATTLLAQWVATGFIARHGEPGAYVYTLKATR